VLVPALPLERLAALERCCSMLRLRLLRRPQPALLPLRPAATNDEHA
jgi:hypothetical protein